MDGRKTPLETVQAQNLNAIMAGRIHYHKRRRGLRNVVCCTGLTSPARSGENKLLHHWDPTITPPLEDYASASLTSRLKRLSETTFQRTWCLELGRGKATTIPPKENRREKDLYRGDLPSKEWDDLFLVRNITLQADGRLDDKSAKVAADLNIPHHQGAGGDDNFEYV